MWVFASPGFAGIFRIDCKNRVKFGPPTDRSSRWNGPGTQACMLTQSWPSKALKALEPLDTAPRGHGVASGDGSPAHISVAPTGCPPR